MPSSSRDPRSFIKPIPLPIPSHKGIVVQARSDRVYNPTVPTRETVRKENYDRRLLQMTQQGFRSVNYKPYQGIGDPFYLDQRKLILHALGQWNEGDDDDISSCDSDNDNEDNMQMYLKKQKSPAKFILKRPRKDLNTLNKEVSHGRNMIRNVRLGHGLFQLIRQERQAKSDRARQEYNKNKQKAMMEWQPPKYDSSSDGETDDELSQDVDLTNDIWGEESKQADGPAPNSASLSRSRSRVAFQGLDGYLEGPESRHTKSSLSRSGSKKKKQVPSRPYTPQHAYIGSDLIDMSISDYETLKESLFHQLCALHWILEAMNTEAPVAMGPITTCWNFKDLGGAKTTVQKLKREKLNETKWNAWVSNQSFTKTTKRLSTGRLTGRTPRRGNLGGTLPTHRSSISSSASPSGSTSTLNLQIIQPEPTRIKNTVQGQTLIPEDKEATSCLPSDNSPNVAAAEDEDAALYKKGLFRFLDEYYDSLSRKEAGEENPGEAGGQNDRSQSPYAERRKHDKRLSDHDTSRHSARKNPEKYLDRYDQSGDRINSSRQHRAESPARAKSSSALVEFVASLPSSKWGNLSAELRLRFAEIGEEKALELHEAIEHLERQRMRVLQNKFVNMPTGGSSFHRALEDMRSRTAKMDEEANKKRKASIHQDWYTELLSHIPHDYKLEWQFEKILDKLRRYGLLESGKQSATKFLKVLNTLRDWEICCPDIIAAVEFCREKIIEMSVEEFEAWFTHTFPCVVRPQTAPPAIKGSEKTKESSREVSARPSRVTTSAPVKMRYGRS